MPALRQHPTARQYKPTTTTAGEFVATTTPLTAWYAWPDAITSEQVVGWLTVFETDAGSPREFAYVHAAIVDRETGVVEPADPIVALALAGGGRTDGRLIGIYPTGVTPAAEDYASFYAVAAA